MLKLVINGKFLIAKMEGMPRVGREITAAIDKLLELPDYKNIEVEILTPKGGRGQINLKNISIREVGIFKGILWEQLEFAFNFGRAYFLNFTGTAPILRRWGCVVIHDAQFRSTSASHGWKTYILYNVVSTIVARRYRHLATVSEYAKQELLQFKVANRPDIQVIHNGADHIGAVAEADSILRRFGLNRNDYALTNSYIHAHKNVTTLLSAFHLICPSRKLVLFGSSTKLNYEEAGISVPENAVFLGRVTDEELSALMHHARMFLYPSTTEGFGLPPLEAMKMGTPTICSNAGAMPEICANGCIYVDEPKSKHRWADAINLLWLDEDLSSNLKMRGLNVASNYTWERAARCYLNLFLSAHEKVK